MDSGCMLHGCSAKFAWALHGFCSDFELGLNGVCKDSCIILYGCRMDYAWIVQGFSLDFAAAEVLCAACGGTVCDSRGGGFCVYLGVGRGSSILLHEI